LCEIKKEFMDFDKTDIDLHLSHLSHLQIAELITGYYNNETNNHLIDKFKLRQSEDDFSEIFPLMLIENSFCKACKNPLYKKFFCRITRKSILSAPFCRQCRIKKQIQTIENDVAEIRAIRHRSMKHILSICFKYELDIEKKLSYQSSLLLSYIYPLLLKRYAKNHDENTVFGLTPDTKLMPLCNNQILEELLIAGCIQLNSNTPTKALVMNQNRVVDLNIYEANWSINTEQGLSKIVTIDQFNASSANAMSWSSDWNNEIKKVWLKIVIDECIEFLLITSAQRSYPIKGVEVCNKIRVTLESLFNKYTQSQCFRIIWSLFQYCADNLENKGIYNRDYEQINSFTAEIFDKKCEEFMQGDYDICGTNRPLFCPRSKLNQLFFNDVLKLKGDSGFQILLSDFIKK